MEALSLMLGLILMLVASIAIVLYVALVVTIPVWRTLDWLSALPIRERVAGLASTHQRAATWLRRLSEQFFTSR
ncbi:MAG: hypothetical protein IT305_32410 [Chloroflexi bacterium]|nr:hypothetical protein [Chloroflexota bacterium]